MRTPVLRSAVLTACLFLSSCAVHGLAFVQDDRVEIESPRDSATVGLPLTLRWRARGFDGKYAIFFDRSPMRPGRSVRSLVPEGDPCRATNSCASAAWLALRDIFVVDGTSLRVTSLGGRPSDPSETERHQVTIVLLNSSGERLGEAAFVREFIVERAR